MKVTALSSVKAINATHVRNIVALFLTVFCTSVLQVEAGAHEGNECSVWTKKYLRAVVVLSYIEGAVTTTTYKWKPQ